MSMKFDLITLCPKLVHHWRFGLQHYVTAYRPVLWLVAFMTLEKNSASLQTLRETSRDRRFLKDYKVTGEVHRAWRERWSVCCWYSVYDATERAWNYETSCSPHVEDFLLILAIPSLCFWMRDSVEVIRTVMSSINSSKKGLRYGR